MPQKKPFVTLAQARAIAAEIPTPFHLYDEAGIRENARKVNAAFSWNKGFKEYFAVKATPNPYILKILQEEGCGVDCSSYTELLMGEACGFTGSDIMFSSNETPAQDMQKAYELGAYINLDDLTHVDFLKETAGIPKTVCCRYNPGSFQITNDIMGHLYDSKFGMTLPQLKEAYKILKQKGVRRFGLHAMLASCSLDENYYPNLARELFRLVLDIRKEIGVEISFVDLSGGIGIPYLPQEKAVDIFKIGEGVRQAYEELIVPAGMELSLFTEMGRYITGPYGYLLTTAIHYKHIYKEYVGVDASCCDLMRPAMYGAYHHITVLGKENQPKNVKVDVVGSLCENNDKFAIDRLLPKIDIGDILVIHDAGAHGHAMGYNYNGKLRCAEYLMEKDGSLKMIRRAETLEDYFVTLDIDTEF